MNKPYPTSTLNGPLACDLDSGALLVLAPYCQIGEHRRAVPSTWVYDGVFGCDECHDDERNWEDMERATPVEDWAWGFAPVDGEGEAIFNVAIFDGPALPSDGGEDWHRAAA